MKNMDRLQRDRFRQWQPPHDWTRIQVIDAHTEGEPLRILIDGFETRGDTIPAKRRDAQQRLDHLRRAMMWEPRGHADMYGCVITPPTSERGDFGVLFLHNEGFSTMCGHGIIGVTKVALETGLLPMETPETMLYIDTPAGLVTAFAEIDQQRVTKVRFHNVPAFVEKRNLRVQVPGLGEVTCDLAFGGAYYAYVDATTLGLRCEPQAFNQLIDTGMAIKRAVMASYEIRHPFEPDLGFLYGTIFTGPSQENHSRHVCIFAEGEVDRCPTGTGVSARMALLAEKEGLPSKQGVVIESILGTEFGGMIVEKTRFGDRDAVIPEVSGRAWITGMQTLLLDPSDPLKHGFILR